jgi:hypothetical protein
MLPFVQDAMELLAKNSMLFFWVYDSCIDGVGFVIPAILAVLAVVCVGLFLAVSTDDFFVETRHHDSSRNTLIHVMFSSARVRDSGNTPAIVITLPAPVRCSMIAPVRVVTLLARVRCSVRTPIIAAALNSRGWGSIVHLRCAGGLYSQGGCHIPIIETLIFHDDSTLHSEVPPLLSSLVGIRPEDLLRESCCPSLLITVSRAHTGI